MAHTPVFTTCRSSLTIYTDSPAIQLSTKSHSPLPFHAVPNANAFYEIAPQSAASTSSSKKPSYDVFINHRGIDVKHKLASTIYQTLDLMGVQAFLDQEELELGDSFPQAIEEAMRSASVHIAIFSSNYAESPWCLEELSLSLKMNVTIIPVFYGVQASDLRYVAKGTYADAFVQHRRKHRYKFKEINKWKKALRRVSYLSGCIMDTDNCDEGKLLRKIVDTTLLKMKNVPLEVATFPVGLDKAVQDFESEFGSSTRSENVHTVGIVGMGGAGKTTLAKELYNRKCPSFSRSSFLSSVRDAASKNNLHKLQKNLLKDLRIQHSEFHTIHQRKALLARHLTSMTVLIVLDDVDDVEQMHALLPPEQYLGQGSFIIVTSRHQDVLTDWGISSMYHMKLLDPFNAKQLFCKHAFLHPHLHDFEHLPENYYDFQGLIDKFVEACNGLPLSLKVFGAMVKGKSKACWESQLHKIPKILPNTIAECLKLSYDALDSETQQMFLDIACFFIGEEKSLVVAIWDGSDWSGELGLETLLNKCIVELDENGCIDMHDQLRDLGRTIARDVLPSRIWKDEQISFQGGRAPVRGIMVGFSRQQFRDRTIITRDLLPSRPWKDEQISFQGGRAPVRGTVVGLSQQQFWVTDDQPPPLQLLAVRGNNFREEFVALSRYLVWLRWCDFNETKLPSWLSMTNLRVLELHNAENLEELWQHDVEPPLQLTQLIIYLDWTNRFWWNRFQLPESIGHLSDLKRIVLKGSGVEMRRLPEEFCHLRSLEFLELSDFRVLSSLPDHFGDLINLRVLVLSGLALTALPDSFKQLRLLEFLDISNSQSFFFTSEMLNVLEFMTKLQILRISYCPQLVELPHLTTQASLRELDLRYTGLREFPNNISQLAKLETLMIGSDNLTSLPGSLGELSCLKSLAIYDCDLLQSLPETFGRLSNLQSLKIEGTPILELGLGMPSPSGCNLKRLTYLSLFDTQVYNISISDSCCPSLQTLWVSSNIHLTGIVSLPNNVKEIIVHGCEKMWNMMAIHMLENLKNLVVTDCPNLTWFPIPRYMYSVGHEINVKGCHPDAMVEINRNMQSRSSGSHEDVHIT